MCTSPQKSLKVEKIRKSANFFMMEIPVLQLYASRCIIFLNRTSAVKKYYARVQ